MKLLTNTFISLFYSGYFKIWPGTFATIVSIVILFPIVYFDLISFKMMVAIFIVLFVLSIFFINYYSSFTNTHDSGIIVIDEFLGVYLIFIFYDLVYISNNFLTIILIFILFRFFDITKIFPANIIDKKIKNSLGVLLDDFVASIYTIIVLCSVNVFI